MSCNPAKLVLLCNGNNFKLWHYETDDEAQLLVSPNYFANARGTVKRGDLIVASCMVSGAKKTELLVVSAVTLEDIMVDGLQKLSNQRDVRATRPRTNDVLTFDGAVWVNAPAVASSSIDNIKLADMAAGTLKGRAGTSAGNPQDLTAAQVRNILNVEVDATAAGAAGDAHATRTGNPHQTTAAQVKAIALAEKGAVGGVATLNEAGKIPAAQLPPHTTLVTYDEVFANDYISPSNSAAENDAQLDELWAAVRASPADRIKVTFPSSAIYNISATISPSGKGYGIGANCWDPRILCIDWGDSQFNVISSDLDRFMEIRRGPGAGQPLNNFQRSSPDYDPCPNDGRFYNTQGNAVPKRVVFNARYQGSIKMLGRLSIRQNNRAPNLWAFGSTGGLDADAPRADGAGYMWHNADLDHIVVDNFEGGIHAAHYNAEQHDSLTRCHIRKYQFSGDSAVFADSNTLDGCVWDHFSGRLEHTTYIVGCPIFTVNAGFFSIGTPAGWNKSVIVIAASQVRWNSYVHLNTGNSDAWACWHLASNGRLIMDQVHQDTGVIYGCKASIYIGRDYNDHPGANQILKIGSLSRNDNFDGQAAPDQRNVVALDCSSDQANKRRQIVFDTWNNLDGPTPKWSPVYPYTGGTSYATSSNDAIRVNFTTGSRQYRFNRYGSEVPF